MKKYFVCILAVTALVVCASFVTAAAPPNDHFYNSEPITDYMGTAFGTNVDATLENGEPPYGYASVWWLWQATFTGEVVFDTIGSTDSDGNLLDTQLGVYTGTNIASLTIVAQDEDSAGNLQSRCTFNVLKDRYYYIAVTSFRSDKTGDIVLNWQQNVSSLNVILSPATAVSDGARWQIDGGAWLNSGTTVYGLSSGPHIVSFLGVEGWTSPDALIVDLSPNVLLTTSAVYTKIEKVFDIELINGMFTTGAASDDALSPGENVDFCWVATATEAVTDPFWCEIFGSKTGGFDQVRTGMALTSSYYNKLGINGVTLIEPGTLKLNSIADGVYTLVPVVNRGTLAAPIPEDNYVNNWLPIAGTRLHVHNTDTGSVMLQMLAVEYQVYVEDEHKLTVSGKVYNASVNAMKKPGCWVEVFYGTLTPEGTFMPQGTIGGGYKINNLEPRMSEIFSLTGRIPTPVTEKAFLVMADSTNVVPEVNKTDNYELLTVDDSVLPPGQPNGIDLAITDLTINGGQLAPAQVAPGDKLKYTVTIQNKGTVAVTSPVYVELFASEDGGASVIPGTTLTWSEQITPPALGKTKTYSFEKTINSIGDGIYTVVAVVNRAGAGTNPGDITPLDNRLAYSGGRVSLSTPESETGQVNIVWSSGPTFTLSGTTMKVTGTVKNVGSTRTGNFWVEAFRGTVQNTTGVFYKSEKLAGGVMCYSLAPNATKNIEISGTVKPGEVVGILADSTDVVAEADETDNYDYSDLVVD